MYDLMYIIFKCQLGFKLEVSAPKQTIVYCLIGLNADSLHICIFYFLEVRTLIVKAFVCLF